MIECPCCHGAKRLSVIEHDEIEGRMIRTHPQCTHCMGRGTVPAEVSEEPQTSGKPIDPG